MPLFPKIIKILLNKQNKHSPTPYSLELSEENQTPFPLLSAVKGISIIFF